MLAVMIVTLDKNLLRKLKHLAGKALVFLPVVLNTILDWFTRLYWDSGVLPPEYLSLL